MKKILLLSLLSSPALGHDGHGATLMHLHGAELGAMALAVMTVLAAPKLARVLRDRSRR